ncbi:MAG TPA: ABC transporter substrate-binding protein [Alcaligenes sp.]|nr:ABC transporter substrate-binding protein [Alcaligenes sp.]HRL26896.1 ABC transporter substrate-binding protein [Alcaligenes sp.]
MLGRWRRWLPFLACALLAACSKPVNSPYEEHSAAGKVLYSAFTTRSPNHLDPALSYSGDETPFTYSIYEPLYGYHYLDRPYRLIPKAAAALTEPVYLDAKGQRLPDDVPGEQVAISRYDIPIKPGIAFQPHPAFAQDDAGRYRYYPMRAADLREAFSISDFEHVGSRALSAQDYVYAFKRLASPRLASPISAVMAEHVRGFKAFGEQLAQVDKQSPRPDWLDLRPFVLPGVQALDDHTLRIEVLGKYPQFKYWLAMTFTAPVPWEAERFYSQPRMAQHGLTLDNWPVGTGPFMLTESQTNRRHVLSRNPLYRGTPYPCVGAPGDQQAGLLDDCGQTMPFLDKVVFSLEKESVPLMGKFLQGYYDIPQVERGEYGVAMTVAANDSADKAARYKKLGLQLRTAPEAQLFYMGFNWHDPVVGKGDTPEQAERNRKLRLAVSIAFDWEQYVSIFMNDQAQVAHGPLPPGVPGYQPLPQGANPYVYTVKDQTVQRRSLDEARALLREAGYPDGRDERTGKPLILYYDSMGGMGSDATVDWMRRQLAQVGLQLEVRATDYNRFQDKMKRGAAQIFLWGWVADYPDAENFLTLLYGPQAKVDHGGENAANYQSAEFDRLYEQMRFLNDGPDKEALIHDMVRVVQHDAPWMFGYVPNAGGAYQSWVRNAKPSLMIRDSLQYYRIDASHRVQLIQAWNRPVWWPLIPLTLALLALVLLVWRMAWQRRRRVALPKERS